MPYPITLSVIALPLLLASLPHAVQAATQEGTILILDKDNAQCSLPIPGEGTGQRVQYEFNTPDSDCKNIKARSIKFDGLPSAAQILITDGYGCGTTGEAEEGDDEDDVDPRNFWVKLRTTKKLTTSGNIEIEDLVSYNKSEIISPGLQMLEKNVKESSLARDRTACIRVITSSSKPVPAPVSATQNSVTKRENLRPTEKFQCGLNEVMTSRTHKGDENNAGTTYTCATFQQGSTDLTVRVGDWSKKIKESSGTYFMCPPGQVMTGRDHWGDENGETSYHCSSLKNGDTDMKIVWSDGWSKSEEESASTYTCPTNEFLVGRYHTGDENGRTRYRCATAQ